MTLTEADGGVHICNRDTVVSTAVWGLSTGKQILRHRFERQEPHRWRGRESGTTFPASSYDRNRYIHL